MRQPKQKISMAQLGHSAWNNRLIPEPWGSSNSGKIEMNKLIKKSRRTTQGEGFNAGKNGET
jgi:hypothetical protein